MPVLNPPQINDGQLPYFYLPYMSNLYGHKNGIHRWLRVTDSDSAIVHTVSMGNEVTDMVYCYGLDSYLTYLTFGFTPFIEVAMSGMRTGVDVTQNARVLLTQACSRSYESRILCLMDLMRRKKSAMLTKSGPQAKELSDELIACLLLWEQLMNSGAIRPAGCLLSHDVPSGAPFGISRTRWIEKKYDELSIRNKESNFVNIPYKMSAHNRMAFLSSYGVTL